MEYDEDVIGITFADLELAESGTELYFTGTALETGVWTDKHGTTLFHPLDVIHRTSHMFMGIQVLCRHNAGKVGEITEVINTQNGMKVRGVLSHPESIQLVLNKTLRGLSVGMRMKIDPVKRILIDIVLAREISLVERPACRVCVLDNGLEIKGEHSESLISQSRSDTMVDEQIEYKEAQDVSLAEQEPEEYPMPNCEEFKDDVEKYEACKEFSESVSLFRKAQDIWRMIFPKEEDEEMDTQNEDTNMTESKPATETKTEAEIVEKVELSQEETVVDVEAEAETEVETKVEVETETEMETTEVEVEVEAEAEVEVEVEAEAEVEVEVKTETETEVEIEAEAEVEVEEVEVEQSAEVLELTAELSEVKQLFENSVTELTSAQVQLAETAAELSITKSQLKTIEDKTRSELVESVMAADPNADTELVDNMSNVQLEAYKNTVTRLSKPKVGSVRKTVNATEKSVEMSSPTTEGDEFIASVIGYLKERQ
ncbi:hypothetical protein GQ473_04355 [archaeon]|nr:hypothetical protein [archaeon]